MYQPYPLVPRPWIIPVPHYPYRENNCGCYPPVYPLYAYTNPYPAPQYYSSLASKVHDEANLRPAIGDLPETALFRAVYEDAASNGFAGGFPTFNQSTGRYEVVLIRPDFGVKQDLRDLPAEPSDFAEHIRNVDRDLRADPNSRYLGGFPNFHRSGRLFGAVRLFKNAGERRWVPTEELGLTSTATDNEFPKELMRKAQNYAVKQGFAGGFPSFEHTGDGYRYEIILLNKTAATVKLFDFGPPIVQPPIDQPPIELEPGVHRNLIRRISYDEPYSETCYKVVAGVTIPYPCFGMKTKVIEIYLETRYPPEATLEQKAAIIACAKVATTIAYKAFLSAYTATTAATAGIGGIIAGVAAGIGAAEAAGRVSFDECKRRSLPHDIARRTGISIVQEKFDR